MSSAPVRERLNWRCAGVVWHAETSREDGKAYPRTGVRRFFRAGQTFGELPNVRRPFALVRPARDSAGAPNPTTGQWLAVLTTDKLPAGITSFDMTTTHPSLAAAKLHIEALAALEGIESSTG